MQLENSKIEAIYAENLDSLRNFLRKRGCEADLADEIIHQSFVKFIELNDQGNLPKEINFRGWLFKACKLRHLKAIRKTSKEIPEISYIEHSYTQDFDNKILLNDILKMAKRIFTGQEAILFEDYYYNSFTCRRLERKYAISKTLNATIIQKTTKRITQIFNDYPSRIGLNEKTKKAKRKYF